MSDSSMATNMGNAGGKRKKRQFEFFNSTSTFFAKRHICDLTKENGSVSEGQLLSFVMAILWSDHVSDLSAEEAVKQVRDNKCDNNW